MLQFRRYLISRLLPALLLVLSSPCLAGAKVLVGVIMTADIPYYAEMNRVFVDELKERLPADEEVQFIMQRPFPDPIAWSNAARKLIAIEVDLIISYGAPATHAVLFEKSDIPVIYAGVYDPEGAGLAGRNLTGCGYRIPLSSLLRYFKRVKKIEKLRVIYSSTEEDTVRQVEELADLAVQQNLEMARVDIRSHSDLKKIKTVGDNDGVYFAGSALAHVWRTDIMNQLEQKNVPAVDIFPDRIKEEEMLITLSHPPAKQGKKAAELSARIIAGEKAGTIEQVLLRETELVFNLIEAKELGISIPMQLVVEATRVIK